ncbi:MAG: recombinase family protein [Planctomycetota bacterium]
MTQKSRLNGKRGVPLLRCSTMTQADTSIDDQLNSIEAFAKRMDMQLGEAVRLAGKSGSIKKNLDGMVDQVIARKHAGERIDVVVYFDQSRFGRSGAMHFGHLADRLSNEGIGLAEVDGYIEDKATADLVRVIKAEAAKRHAMSISDSSARGSQSSLQNKRRSHSVRPAFGIDKLYLDPQGNERMIIRRLQDGSSVEIDPATGKFGVRYEPGVRAYRKGPLELDTLVPGDPKARKIVIRIFRMHHEDGFGGSRIARVLNDEDIRSATGGRWHKATIDSILRNEVYTGCGYANRISNAIYCNQSPDLPRQIDDADGRLIRGVRPSEDWHVVEYPRLRDYLPTDIREKVMASQAEYRERISAGYIKDPKRANGRRKYLLSGLMTEKTTGRKLKAIKSGDSSRTYYGMKGGSEQFPSGSFLRRRLPAPPLHRAVLEEIESLLCSLPDLESMITEAILQQDRHRRGDADQQGQLIAEREQLRNRYRSQVDMLGGIDDGLVRESINKTAGQIQLIDDRLASMNSGPALTEREVCEVTKGVIEDMQSLLERFAEEGEPALRSVAEAVVGSAVADLEESEVDIELVVPAAFIERRVRGLAERRRPEAFRQAPKWEPILLDAVTIELPERCSKACWEPFKPSGCDDCRRQRKAA